MNDTSPSLGSPRRQSRRKQVLDAARRCFREAGFHAASMARIAAEAGMGVSLIYRHFASKEEIIAGIVREQVDGALELFPSANLPGPEAREQLRMRARDAVLHVSDPAWSSLTIEVRAEAGRNAQIADIVRAADAKISERVKSLIIAAQPDRKIPDDLDRRSELLSIVIEGILFRSPIYSAADKEQYTEASRDIVDMICDYVFSPC